MRYYRGKPGKIAGIAAYAAFLIATIAWFAFYQFPQASIADARRAPADPAVQPDRYAGAIVLRGGAGGGCRQVKFDNLTGSLEEAAAVACRDGKFGANSTEGRMDAIRNSFSKK